MPQGDVGRAIGVRERYALLLRPVAFLLASAHFAALIRGDLPTGVDPVNVVCVKALGDGIQVANFNFTLRTIVFANGAIYRELLTADATHTQGQDQRRKHKRTAHAPQVTHDA